MSRASVKERFERACNYYDNRTRARSAIADPYEDGFLAPLMNACEIVEENGWLAARYAGTVREQLATHFALRGVEMMEGLQGASKAHFENARRRGMLAQWGYGDTALFLALRHKRLFRISNDIRHVENGGNMPRSPSDDPFRAFKR